MRTGGNVLLALLLLTCCVHWRVDAYRPPLARGARTSARGCAVAAGPVPSVQRHSRVSRAHVVAYEPVTLLQSIGSAFESELAAYPLRVNAIVTGCTFLLGDGVAQCVEKRGREDVERAKSRLEPAHAATSKGICKKRLARSFATGLLVLGPLTHCYYHWMSSQDLEMSVKVLLDNTLFLAADNLALLVSLTILGGAPHGAAALDAADASELFGEKLGELWAMQMTGWRILPLVSLMAYGLVPSQHRVIFVDLADVVYAAMLSLQLAGKCSETADQLNSAVPLGRDELVE